MSRLSANKLGRKLHRYSVLIKFADCTTHRIHESQLDELLYGEVKNLKEKIIAESEKHDEIVKQWLKQKPANDLQIRQYEEKTSANSTTA